MHSTDQTNLQPDAIPGGPARAARRGSTWLRAATTLADQGIVSLTTFATIWLMNRLLGPEMSKVEQGMYGLIYASVWVFAREILQSLVSTPHTIAVPTKHGMERRFLNGSSMLHQLVITGLISAALFVAAGIVRFEGGLDGQTRYAMLLTAAAAATPPLLLWNFVRIWCFSLRRMQLALVLDVCVSTLTFSGIFLLWHFSMLRAEWVVVMIGLANLLPVSVVMFIVRREFSFDMKQAQRDAWSNWTTARWLLGSSMIWACGLYLYPWLITGMRGASDAGIYAFCFTMAGLGNPLLFAVQNWLGPHIAHAFVANDGAGFRKYIYKATWGFALLMTPVALAMAFFAESLLHVIGRQYVGNGHTVGLLALAMIPQAVSFALSRGLFSMGRASLDLAANITPIVVFAVVGVILVRHYGPEGAAASMVLAQLSGATFRLVAFSRMAVDQKPIEHKESVGSGSDNVPMPSDVV